jgi:SpoVK/Ycf46/Vps4 family AAA+-type ATPase
VPPQKKTGPLPYSTSAEHLSERFSRIDQLVRAQVVRWRLTIATTKPPNLWGMVHVSDVEIDHFLGSQFLGPRVLPEGLESALSEYWKKAEEIEATIKAREGRTPRETAPRLDLLQRLFNLSDLDRDILTVALFPEIDDRYRRLFGYLQDDASRILPTVELLLQILYPVARVPDFGFSAFGAGAPLRSNRIIVLSPGQEEEHLALRSVRVDDRITAFLLGRDEPDGRLRSVVTERTEEPDTWAQLSIDAQQVAKLQAFTRSWEKQREQASFGATLLLHGTYGSGRLAAARAICRQLGVPLLVVDAEAALRFPSGWEEVVQLSFREARLRAGAIYWSKCESLLTREQPAINWEELLRAAESFPGLCFLASTVGWDPAGSFQRRAFLRFDFPVPAYPLRKLIWQKHLTQAKEIAESVDRDVISAALANGFQLTEGQIRDSVATAIALAARRDPEKPRLNAEDLYEGCRRQSGRRLMAMARRVEPRTQLTFDDLILPPANRRQFEEVRARVRLRSRVYSGLGFERRLSLGKGLIVIFTGSSGTGKTTAAELLAREQGVDMYKVDLSSIVSKWVGETEKNLSQLFAEAEDANAIIFFDEADALFGKRGEVKGAQDRWANLEVNFLLQRVEEYSGVVILATNLSQNIDEAFMRRIQAIVEFPSPDAEARFRILRGMFPAGVQPPPDDELRALATQVKLPGGSLRNIVVDAAFRALPESEGEHEIELRHLVLATGREYQKLGKPITKGEFGQKFYAWLEQELL